MTPIAAGGAGPSGPAGIEESVLIGTRHSASRRRKARTCVIRWLSDRRARRSRRRRQHHGRPCPEHATRAASSRPRVGPALASGRPVAHLSPAAPPARPSRCPELPQAGAKPGNREQQADPRSATPHPVIRTEETGHRSNLQTDPEARSHAMGYQDFIEISIRVVGVEVDPLQGNLGEDRGRQGEARRDFDVQRCIGATERGHGAASGRGRGARQLLPLENIRCGRRPRPGRVGSQGAPDATAPRPAPAGLGGSQVGADRAGREVRGKAVAQRETAADRTGRDGRRRALPGGQRRDSDFQSSDHGQPGRIQAARPRRVRPRRRSPRAGAGTATGGGRRSGTLKRDTGLRQRERPGGVRSGARAARNE